MGGRGASSGWSKDKHGNPKNPYGSQYRSVLTAGNVKFVSKNSRQSEPLMETMTSGRVYAHVEGGDLKSIVYFDKANKRVKQIDVDHQHKGLRPHTHHGYDHSENDSAKGASSLTTEERKMVDRVSNLWNNRKRGK